MLPFAPSFRLPLPVFSVPSSAHLRPMAPAVPLLEQPPHVDVLKAYCLEVSARMSPSPPGILDLCPALFFFPALITACWYALYAPVLPHDCEVCEDGGVPVAPPLSPRARSCVSLHSLVRVKSLCPWCHGPAGKRFCCSCPWASACVQPGIFRSSSSVAHDHARQPPCSAFSGPPSFRDCISRP